MRIVVQRVTRASVTVDGEVVGAIDSPGLCLLVGATHDDTQADIDRIWTVLAAFASFGFCKAHAAAFALPTYQSAWLKRHYPAHFLAGLLVHDPGMYPKRLIIEEARRMHIAILGLDVNASAAGYRVEQLPARYPTGAGQGRVPAGLPDGSAWGIRLALSQVQGISADDVQRIEAGQPYQSLSDFCSRARVDFPVVENLVLTGGFDRLYGIHVEQLVQRPGQVTRRDLLLALADLKRVAMAEARVASRARGLRQRRSSLAPASDDPADLARRQAVGEVIPARASPSRMARPSAATCIGSVPSARSPIAS